MKPQDCKSEAELNYWQTRFEEEKRLSNEHYLYFYTSHFNLEKSFYDGKKVLDIGCGPGGSIEWADMASERIGLDPLAHSYRKFWIKTHKMKYVCRSAENLPFLNNSFDIVCSFNPLDHVDDLDQTIGELTRVITPSGIFLLLTDLNHQPTETEPMVFSWEVAEKFLPSLKIIEERHYEKLEWGMYQSIHAGIPYDHHNKTPRYGILSAMFKKSI